jgi:hypothetical protein
MSQKQARALIEQAKETLGSWSMFWSSNTNLETAAELYVKAGNSFQLVSMCKSFYSARITPYVFIKSLMVISALLILFFRARSWRCLCGSCQAVQTSGPFFI